MSDRDAPAVRKMAELLRKGASMLAQPCPKCGSPLLKVGDKIYCANCDQQFAEQSGGQPTLSQSNDFSESPNILTTLHSILVGKLKLVGESIEQHQTVESLTQLVTLLLRILEALEIIETAMQRK
ncbi:MAG: Sjogren's syndrome/scleroderma autoantigen 1 family protein [Promethearchaeia archaeon]